MLERKVLKSMSLGLRKLSLIGVRKARKLGKRQKDEEEAKAELLKNQGPTLSISEQ